MAEFRRNTHCLRVVTTAHGGTIACPERSEDSANHPFNPPFPPGKQSDRKKERKIFTELTYG